MKGYKLLKPMKPPPEWKCPKGFKLGLGEPWESQGSESGTHEDECANC